MDPTTLTAEQAQNLENFVRNNDQKAWSGVLGKGIHAVREVSPEFEGKFIVLEGVDGTGKTTQLDILKRYLEKQNVKFVTTKSPGGTAFGNEIRRILFESIGTDSIWPDALELLFLASHLHNLHTWVIPNLKDGNHVIADRHWPSSVAYMHQRGASQFVKDFYQRMRGMDPDLMILLHCDVETAFSRANFEKDRSHQKGKKWNTKEDFLEIQGKFISHFYAENWCVPVCTDSPVALDVFNYGIKQAVDRLLGLDVTIQMEEVN